MSFLLYLVQICPGLNANEMHALYNKHQKVYRHVKVHQNTRFLSDMNMKMVNNPVIYEVVIKQYPRSTLDISDRVFISCVKYCISISLPNYPCNKRKNIYRLPLKQPLVCTYHLSPYDLGRGGGASTNGHFSVSTDGHKCYVITAFLSLLFRLCSQHTANSIQARRKARPSLTFNIIEKVSR